MSDASQATAAPQSEKGSILDQLLTQKTRSLGYTKTASEKLPGSRWRFKVTIDEQDVALVLAEVIKEFTKFAALPGFRPGKAPAALVKTRFDRQAREEMVRRLTPRVAEIVAEAEGLTILGQGVLISYHSDKPIGTHIEFAVEVQPSVEVTAATLEGVTAKTHKIIVDDAAVDAAIDRLRARSATYEPVKGDYAYKAGDGLLFDCTTTDERGEVIPDLSDSAFYTTEIEKFLPAEVVAALVGHKRGETLVKEHTYTHNVRHPGDAEAHEHSHTHKYSVTLREIKQRVLPTLDDEFAKDVAADCENLAQLREKVRKDLDRAAAERTRREVLTQVYNELGERLKIELPQSMLERSFQNNVVDVERRLRAQDMTLNQIDEARRQQLLGQMAANTRADLRNYFIAEAVAKFKGIEVTEEHINEELKRVAAARGRKPLAIRGELEANKTFDRFKSDLRLRLTNDFLFALPAVSFEGERSGADAADAAEGQEPMAPSEA